MPFVTFHVAHVEFLLFHGIAASLLLSLLGLAGGIWSEKFDHIAAVTNFVVPPAAFLSGTFYTIDRLPPPWHELALFNPFFYMIDGFRYGFLGTADSPVMLGSIVILAIDVALAVLCYTLLSRGWKIKN